ncbi:hypothetical protein V8F20_006438 [Naviculisporaceae sp. PSN 640]
MDSGNLPGESRAYQIQVPCAVFLAITTFVVAVRLWARIKLRSWSGIGWDDGIIVVSWVFASIVSALMIAACNYGFGQHIANLTPTNKLMTLKLFYIAQSFYKLTINLTKTSILLLYLRIFVKKWFRITCSVLLGLVLGYMVATFAASVWQCTPISRAWDKTIAGTCLNITANWYANAGFSISTDFMILALPMYPIYTSMLPLGQKVALMVVFALGVFTTITSILRMQTLKFSVKSPDITCKHSPRQNTLTLANEAHKRLPVDIDSSIWTMIEINLAIICACLPVCRLPLAYALPAYFSTDSIQRLTGSGNASRVCNASTARHSCASMSRFSGGVNALSSLQCYTNKRNSTGPYCHHIEKSLTELMIGRPSTGSPTTIWEPDFDGGATNDSGATSHTSELPNVGTCATAGPGVIESRAYADDKGNGGGGSPQDKQSTRRSFSTARRKTKDSKAGVPGTVHHDRTDSGSGVIRMITHYSITYDDNTAAPGPVV